MKDLHDAIILLPCTPGALHESFHRAYEFGHRDARHAAAELALGVEAGELKPASWDYVVKLLVAAGHVDQKKVDEACAIARSIPDTDANATWLTEAHALCADMGIAPGHILQRLIQARTMTVPAWELTDAEIEPIVRLALRVHMLDYPAAAQNSCVEVAYQVARAVLAAREGK